MTQDELQQSIEYLEERTGVRRDLDAAAWRRVHELVDALHRAVDAKDLPAARREIAAALAEAKGAVPGERPGDDFCRVAMEIAAEFLGA